MKVSYLVVFGALSRMVKVRGACDKLRQEHSQQSVFLTILTGDQPELFSRLLAISSGSEATG